MATENTDRSITRQSLKPVALVAVAALVVLLIGSLVYWRERMLFIDAPHILFRIINDGSLQVTEHRYGSFITQLIPWLGVKLHLSLKGLMLLYSSSFYLFYLSVMLLLVYRFRAYAWAVVLGLYFTLFVSDTFYWPNNEVHQGIVWLALAYALLNDHFKSGRNASVQLALAAVIFFIAIWTHPLVGIVAIFLLPFSLVSAVRKANAMAIPMPVLIIALVAIKWYQGMHHGYDSGKIETVTTFDLHHIASVFSSPQFKWFLKNCFVNYWLFTLAGLAGIVMLVKERRYKTLGWVMAFTLAYLLLVCITFREVGDRFYMESEYAPLTVIVVLPFVLYVLPRMKAKYAMVAMAIVCGIRFVYIAAAAPIFKNRLVQLDTTLEKMKAHGFAKAVVQAGGNEADRKLIMSWGVPVESLMLSALNGEKPQRTFIYAPAEDIAKTMSVGRDTLIGCWEKRPVSKLNERYFQIDTTSGYKPMIIQE